MPWEVDYDYHSIPIGWTDLLNRSNGRFNFGAIGLVGHNAPCPPRDNQVELSLAVSLRSGAGQGNPNSF